MVTIFLQQLYSSFCPHSRNSFYFSFLKIKNFLYLFLYQECLLFQLRFELFKRFYRKLENDISKWHLYNFFLWYLCPISLSFFFWPCLQHVEVWKFPGQGLNPCYSSDPNHCSDNTRSLTCCSTRELHRALFPFSC